MLYTVLTNTAGKAGKIDVDVEVRLEPEEGTSADVQDLLNDSLFLVDWDSAHDTAVCDLVSYAQSYFISTSANHKAKFIAIFCA